MQLTKEQLTFFDLFGYLVLPGCLRDEIAWIDEEFERIVSRPDFRMVPFIDASPRLCTLLDHPVITGVADALLGTGFNYMAGDGGLRSGESVWHSDGSWLENPDLLKTKFILYLDALDEDNGCLRVMPGSHRVGEGFAELLEGHAWQMMRDSSAQPLGVDMHGWPCVPLRSRPGDLIVFNHHLKHASFFGGSRRRYFDLNLIQRAETPAQIEQLRKYLLLHLSPWGDTVYGEHMLAQATASRMVHLRQALEHQHVLLEARSAARQAEADAGAVPVH